MFLLKNDSIYHDVATKNKMAWAHSVYLWEYKMPVDMFAHS